MNWILFICCLLGLFFAIEARCLPRAGNMWQQQLPSEDIASCSAPSLLHSVPTSSANAGEVTKIDMGASEVALPSVTLTKYVHEWASNTANMASTCSLQAPELEPKSKPESTYPEWECKQELKQHELLKPEVPKRRTVTLTGSGM